MKQDIWYSGRDDYIKYIYSQDPTKTMNKFEVVLQDKPYDPSKNIYTAFMDHFDTIPKKVELLFSGGLDSSLVLDLLLENNIPVECITMNIQFDGVTINTHDLYFSEKITREKSVKRSVVTLNAKKFYEQGDYKKYLTPYRIIVPHVASHFWLLEQCTTFPMLGGEYNWAWNPNHHIAISPPRHAFTCFDRHMKLNSISGVGNPLGYSQEINLMCIREHVKLLKEDTAGIYGGEEHKVIFLKKKVYETLSGKIYEPRLRSFGWESVSTEMFDRLAYRQELLDMFGDITLRVSWNKNVGDVLGGEPGTWTRFQ